MDNCMILDEVVFNILVWLPVVSLLRFRSVCKTWRAIIDSSYFINQHLLHVEDDNSNGSLILMGRELGEWFVLSGHQFELRMNLDLSTHLPLHKIDMAIYDEDTTWMPLNLEGSCNGVICLSCERPVGRLRVALWNPATKKLACLPEPTNLYGESVRTKVAFGYAVKANDYKVVRVVEFTKAYSFVAYHRVEAYSLQTDSWRNVDIDLPAGAYTFPWKATYVNGYCYWMLRLPESCPSSAKNCILSLDLSNEVFETIQLPEVLSTKIIEPYLTTMSDSIACFDSFDGCDIQDDQFDIWVLTKYGVKWTKLYMIRLNGTYTTAKPEGFSKEGKFLLVNNWNESGNQLALLDPKTQELTNLHIQYFDVAVYKESLVSVKKAVHLTRAQSNIDNGPVPDVRDGTSRVSPGHKNMDGEYVRLFVDAAFKDNACKYGVVVLDVRDRFVEAAAGSMYLGSPLEAECFAIGKGLDLLAKRTYSADVIFSDSLLAVQYLHSHSNAWPWHLQGILTRVLNLWNPYNCVDIKHVSRGSNCLEHILAKEIIYPADNQSWNRIPPCLLDFL